MEKTIMLKRKNDFRNVFSKGKCFASEYINMYILKNRNDYNRLAIAIVKKQGKAVERNRFKRLIRENYKNFESSLNLGYDILFIINKNKISDSKSITFYDIQNSMSKLLKKSRILNEENIN